MTIFTQSSLAAATLSVVIMTPAIAHSPSYCGQCKLVCTEGGTEIVSDEPVNAFHVERSDTDVQEIWYLVEGEYAATFEMAPGATFLCVIQQMGT